MLTIRTANIDDAPLIRRFIGELAEYEKSANEVRTTAEDIARDGFGSNPAFRAFIAEWHGQPAGFALFFGYFSTWRGTGLYLEDLFVRTEFRGQGIGKALLAAVARTATDENRNLLMWSVLNWNQPAIEVYKAIGGEFLDDWRTVLLTGDALASLARSSPSR